MMNPTILDLSTRALFWLVAAAHGPTADVTQQLSRCNSLIEQASWDAYAHECVADGFRFNTPGGEGDVDGKVEFWKRVEGAFPDIHLEERVVLADAHEVVSVLLVTGTHEGTLHCHGEWPATHKQIRVLAVQKLELDANGRATEEWLLYNFKDVLNQIGVTPRS